MIALDIVNSVLMTTDDTETFLYNCFSYCTEKDKKIVLRELNRPFSELQERYIYPKIFILNENNQLEFHSNYQKNRDDFGDVREFFISEDATNNWLSRKQEELSKINLTYQKVKVKKNELKTIDNTLNNSQLKELYHFLSSKENPFIIDCSFKDFIMVFSADNIHNSPQIKWIKPKVLFFTLFELLNYFEIINLKGDEISSIVYYGNFFIKYNTKDKKESNFGQISKYSNRAKILNQLTDFFLKKKKLQFKKTEDRFDFKSLALKIKSFER